MVMISEEFPKNIISYKKSNFTLRSIKVSLLE